MTSSDGSSYIELGNTKVMCNVTGPHEPSSRSVTFPDRAHVSCDVYIAPFSGQHDRVRRRNDKKVGEMQAFIAKTFTQAILVNLLQRTEINIALHVLSQDGSVLAACINAATLAIIDAGIPMSEYICAVTVGQPSNMFAKQDAQGGGEDPWLDVNHAEENDIPSLTVATVGESEKIALLVLESKVRIERLEGMVAVGIGGCGRIRQILDEVVKRHGRKVLEEADGTLK